MSHRSVALLLPALCAALLAACGGDGGAAGGGARAEGGSPTSSGATAPGAPATTAERTATGCRLVQQPPPKKVAGIERPSGRLPRGRAYDAVLATSCGTFTIRLDTRRAPKTAASFASLARQGFFDRTTFHRVVPGFVIQGGDPKGDGTGGPGYQVVEAPPRGVRYRRYTVAMAKTQTDPSGASGSQFYVVTSAQADQQLERVYALLGQVVAGRAVVDRIASVATDPSTQRPVDPVVIDSVKIRRR